jgi:hypothetical protein
MMPLWTIARPSRETCGMRVALAGHAVRGPAGVGDADVARDRARGDRVLEHLDLADRAQALHLSVGADHATPAES